MTELQRRLLLEGAINLCDMGGYRTTDQRDSLYAGWQRAVERAKGWDEA